ncbi:Hsp20/alpha crystallin family protein [Halopiger goleimassiliensis]|uniref:Hsp20/alpha crystallin family protein n=1 Tax=Halopiger goleimassiliensis TaxID=1293048 RepID=UPI000B220D5D|nr:Hsp20/alpha crystallin family protein [Halopiger goleimassiliensis]
MPSRSIDSETIPVRTAFDPETERLTLVADVFPATVDDVRVAVGSRRLRVTVSRDGRSLDGYVEPPSDRVFTDDRRAFCNNGVLTVDLGTRRSRVRHPSSAASRP